MADEVSCKHETPQGNRRLLYRAVHQILFFTRNTDGLQFFFETNNKTPDENLPASNHVHDPGSVVALQRNENSLHLAVTMGLISLEPVVKKWVLLGSHPGETDVSAVA